MEKIRLTFAEGNRIYGTWELPVYWTIRFGQQDLMELYKKITPEFDSHLLDKIIPLKQNAMGHIIQEHFILRHLREGGYSIEDRNPNPLTYLNNQILSKMPCALKENDVITLPLLRRGQLVSLFIQFGISHSSDSYSTNPPQMQQLMQCSKTAEFFIVYWEEDLEFRKHFAVKTAKIEGNVSKPSPSGAKNLRPASEVPCPFCGNLYPVYCPKCKIWVCYDGEADTVKCPGCNRNYKLKDMIGDNVDIKTL